MTTSSSARRPASWVSGACPLARLPAAGVHEHPQPLTPSPYPLTHPGTACLGSTCTYFKLTVNTEVICQNRLKSVPRAKGLLPNSKCVGVPGPGLGLGLSRTARRTAVS